MEREATLTDKDHRVMDKMLADVLDAYKDGSLSKTAAVSGLAHVMAALDIGNTGEAIAWFNQRELAFFKDVNRGLTGL